MSLQIPPDFIKRPIAHRALHDLDAGRPENSRAAIQAAIDYGYGIEIDVQLSADGQAMVFHDYDLRRLTEDVGAVGQRIATDLAQISLKGGNEGIPTLGEVVALVDGRVPLLVEIKDQDGSMGTDVGPLEHAVAEVLNCASGAIAVMSFNPHSVALMAELVPQVPRGLVTSAYRPEDWPLKTKRCDQLREIPDYVPSRASFISHEAADLARPRVAELRSSGAAVLCWTIRSEAEEASARRYADNVTFEGYLPRLSG
ncbi:MAG: glycerophosphodiester phosphodiesterase family protein [Pseudomonadota bacterium]